MAAKSNGKSNGKKRTAGSGESAIPSYTNLIDQVRSAAAAIDRLLEETSIGSPEYMVRMKIVRKNASEAGEAVMSILDAMSPIIKRNGELNAFGKTIMSFDKVNPDGFVKFMRGMADVLSDRGLNKDLAQPLENMKAMIDIITGVGDASAVKNMAKISDLMENITSHSILTFFFLKKSIKLQNKSYRRTKRLIKSSVIWSFFLLRNVKKISKQFKKIGKRIKRIILYSILLNIVWKKIGKTISNVAGVVSKSIFTRKKKTLYTLGDLLKDLNKFVVQSFLLAVFIIPASAVIIPAMAILKLVIKSVLWATNGLGKIGRKRTRMKINNAVKNIIAIGAAFALLTLTLYEVGQAAQTPEMMDGMKAFALVVGLAVGTLIMISFVKKRAVLGALALGIVGLALLGFAAVAKIIMGMEMGKDAWKSFGLFAAVIGVGVAAVVAAGFAGVFVGLGAISLAMTAAALIVFMIPVRMINSLGPGEDIWTNFGFFAAVIGLGVGAAVAAGLPGVFLFAMKGSIVLLLTASVLTKYASAMQTIASMANIADLEKMKAFVGATGDVMNAMKTSVKGTGIKEIWKIGKLYGAMGDAMLKMAEAYEIMGRIDADPQALASAVSIMMKGAVDAFVITAADPQVKAALDEMNDWGVKGIISNITGKKSAVSKLLALSGKIGEATAGLAAGIRDMAMMRVKIYDINGRPTGFRTLTNNDFSKAADGMTTIIMAIFRSIGDANKDKDIKKILKGDLEDTAAWKVIESSKEIGAAIGSLAGGVKEMSAMTFTDETGKKVRIDPKNAGQNIASLITTMYSGFADIEIDNKLPGRIKDTASSLETLVKTTGGLDMSKAEKMKSLLEKINELGRGINWNFKELADVINGKLIDTLEQLKEALEGAGDAFSGKPNGDITIPTYTSDGNPPAPASGPMKPAASPQASLNDEFKNTISSSIEEIKATLRELVDASHAGGLGVNVRNIEDLR